MASENLPLVSIVIPVYNVSQYLAPCVKSVLNQTYTNLEIILVDDGSTDGSEKICDEQKKRDGRIVVIHKKNGGLSDARNAGIEAATGKYISFIDSDDIIHRQMIFNLMKPLLTDSDADISCCRFEKFVDGEEMIVNTNSDDKHAISDGYNRDASNNAICDSDDSQLISMHDLFEKPIWTTSWAKIYKSSLLNEIRFPVERLHEDEFTTYKICYAAKKIYWTENKFYFYRQRAGSIMDKQSIRKFSDLFDALSERLLFFETREEEKLSLLTAHEYLDRVIDLQKQNSKTAEAKKLIQKSIREIWKYFGKFNLHDKVRILVCRYFPAAFNTKQKIMI